MPRHKGRLPSVVMRIDLPEDGNINEAIWRLIKRIICFPICEPNECADCDTLREIVAELLRINHECRLGERMNDGQE